MPPKEQQVSDSGQLLAPKLEAAEDSASDTATPAASTPAETPTPSSASAPPRRLDSLARKSAAPRGKAVVPPKPKFAGRRSQAARQELEAAEKKKKEEEAKAAAEEKKQREQEARKYGYRGGRGGGRGGRGRGGHMGDSRRQKDQEAASGPFSSGQVGADGNKRWNASGSSSATGVFSGGIASSGSRFGGGGGGGGGGAGGSSSGSRSAYLSGGSAVKTEPGTGDKNMGGMRSISTEDGGYVSSDEDDPDLQMLAKQNIDQMQVVDLTEDDTAPEQKAFAPVRLAREPHQERAIGLVTEEELPNRSDGVETATDKRKGKQKAGGLQVTGSTTLPRRPAAYSSSDTEGEPRVKEEPAEDEHQTRPTTPEAGNTYPGVDAAMSSPPRDMPSSPESKRKAKERIKELADATDDSDVEAPSAPRFTTQAEKDEWDRYQSDLRTIRRELGRQVPKSADQPDVEGDTTMAESNPKMDRARKQEEIRRQHVYLFQMPPVLPNLNPVEIKPEPEGGNENNDAMDVDQQIQVPVSTAEVKKESVNTGSTHPKLPSGRVGKLRIHKSGKATLDWGGTSMIVGMGIDASFLQNILIARVPETKPKDGDKMAEEDASGMGMGQVRGKFVLTPDWDKILP